MSTMSPIQSTFYRRAVLCFAAVFSFFLQGIAGDYYVYLNDGTVRVCPDSCVLKKFKSGKDRILYIYPLVGEPFKYSLDDIALDTDTPIRDLPTITSFKFNNKYNYHFG